MSDTLRQFCSAYTYASLDYKIEPSSRYPQSCYELTECGVYALRLGWHNAFGWLASLDQAWADRVGS